MSQTQTETKSTMGSEEKEKKDKPSSGADGNAKDEEKELSRKELLQQYFLCRHVREYYGQLTSDQVDVRMYPEHKDHSLWIQKL